MVAHVLAAARTVAGSIYRGAAARVLVGEGGGSSPLWLSCQCVCVVFFWRAPGALQRSAYKTF